MRPVFGNTIVCIAVIFVGVGCQTPTPKPSVLDNPVCAPPCWQNIVPGVTTGREFLNVIKSYRYLDQESLQYNGPWQGFNDLIRGRLRLSPETMTYFNFFFLNDKIADLSFQADRTLTFDQAIKKLGEPTSVVVVQEQGEVFVELII